LVLICGKTDKQEQDWGSGDWIIESKEDKVTWSWVGVSLTLLAWFAKRCYQIQVTVLGPEKEFKDGMR
jgi:hypothetical protein